MFRWCFPCFPRSTRQVGMESARAFDHGAAEIADAEAMDALLSAVPEGSTVAVVSMLGSICPITLAHVQCYEEARKLLLDQTPAVPRPEALEPFAACVGFLM